MNSDRRELSGLMRIINIFSLNYFVHFVKKLHTFAIGQGEPRIQIVLVQRFLFVILTCFISLMSLVAPAQADTLQTGEKIFQANCAACHVGGHNLIIPEKNLKLSTLQQFAMDSEQAITRQVQYGKNIMPAFGTALSEEEVSAVANYVLHQAQNNWQSAE